MLQTVTRSEVLARARSAIGRPTIYKIGKGGFLPSAVHPANAHAECDCCLTAETMVSTVRGAMPIADVCTGDSLWTWDAGVLVPRRVTATYAHGEREILRLRTPGRELLLTANHPVMTPIPLARERLANGRFGQRLHVLGWKPAGSLRRGDWAVTARQLPFASRDRYDPEAAWLLGLYLADGSSSGRGVAICVYGATRERVRAFFDSRFGIRGSYSDRHGFSCTSVAAVAFLREAGVLGTSGTKHWPDWCGHQTREGAVSLLLGYLDGDGYRGDRSYASWVFASVNRDLIGGARALCQALGIRTSTLSRNPRKSPIIIKGRTIRRALPLFTFEAYPESNRSGESQAYSRASASTADFAVQRIKEIAPAGIAPVYDLTVEGQHNFLADGLVVHNSGFVAWCLGISRHLDGPWYGDHGGEWFETTAIATDAQGPQHRVERIEWADAVPSDLLVYGDHDGHQGHVGLVSLVDPSGPIKAIHCSNGNFKNRGDAIQETGVGLWAVRGIVARFAMIEDA